MSLALSQTADEYNSMLQKIRYFGGHSTEASRKHFISADWLPDLIEKKLIEDITQDIYSDAKKVTQTVTKLRWFEKTKDKDELESFKKSGLPHNVEASLFYISIEKLFQDEVQALNIFPEDKNKEAPFRRKLAIPTKLVAKIPDGAILSFIARDPDSYIEKIGSPLLVAHIGIAVKKRNRVYLRHADLPRGSVLDLPLETFLRSTAKRFRGVNISEMTLGN
jgi:hypothetical protein